jgi:hypothetical protein
VISYRGRWIVSVIGKDSDWPQRVIIGGATVGNGVLSGMVGQSRLVDGDTWDLTIEHNDGSGWSANEAVTPDPMVESGVDLSQVVRSKDVFRPGDVDPNDLVVRVDKTGPAFEVTTRPFAADAATLTMLADGVFVNLNGPQLMGMTVRNSWGRPWQAGEFALDVSPLGRATLATFGATVVDAWPPQTLAATQQQFQGRAVVLPQLDVGESHLLFFILDTAAAHRGKPEVEFILMSSAAAPDPANPMRYSRRQVYLAEVGYDPATGTASVRIPEGTLTLRMQAMLVDERALTEVCADVRDRLASGAFPGSRGLLDRVRAGRVDERVCRELFELVRRCLCDCRDGSGGGGDGPGGGWTRVCSPEGLWLPLRFEYGVEVGGGFEGQHGPLAFDDPWWKVVLLIVAVLAWLVGVIASIVADATGWGNQGDVPRGIGTVGRSDRTSTDACIIELNGSRPALQDVADVIPGETNNNPIASAGTVIPIDPQVALPSLAPGDVVGHLVYKSGARTGLTHGIISSIGPSFQCRGEFDEATLSCTPDPKHPDLHLPKQFSIGTDPAFGEELFDDHGDSGSVVLSREPATMNQVVGLLHSSGGTTSPIQDVLSALNLQLR